MTNWEQPHWSGKPQQQADARPRLKPNVFANLARLSAHNAFVVIVMAVLLGGLAAGLAVLSIRIVPASQPIISLDAQTEQAQAALDKAFPGIDKTFFATVESQDPNYARDSAIAVGTELRNHDTLFKAVIVPGTGPFYERFGLLFRPLDDVDARVANVLQSQPLYHALGSAPSLEGLAAFIEQIAKTITQGRSPPGLEGVLLAMSSAVEGQVSGNPRAIDWRELAGLRPVNESKRWFIIAQPVSGKEAEAAVAAQHAASRITGLTWSFPPHTFDGRPANVVQDFAIPAILSLFVVTIILMAGLGSSRETLAVLASAAVTLAISTGIAAATRPVLDSATWSLAAAVLAPAFLFPIQLVTTFGEARARGKSTLTAIMLSAHRQGPRIVVFAALFEAMWLTWLPRKIDSLAILAVCVAAGIVVAAVLSLTLVPAILAQGRQRPEPGRFHWIDDALAAPAGNNLRNARAVFVLVLMAASVFCTLFVPSVKFGDAQLRGPRGDTFTAPTAVGAVHLVARPNEAKALVERIGNVPEAGAVRWIEQFVPQDVDSKRNALMALLDILPGLSEPVPPGAGNVSSVLLGQMQDNLKVIANHPTTADSLRQAAHRLRRSLDLYASNQQSSISDVAALEQALFGGLPALAEEANRLAGLPKPAISDLDDDLRRHFVSGDGHWRFEILPKPGTSTISFAAAMRRLTPDAAGVPIVALARNEIMHHEALMAFAPALAVAGLIVIAFVRRADRMAVALTPTLMALALCAAALAASDELIDAAALAALTTTIAASFSASLIIALGGRRLVRGEDWEMDVSFRSAVLPLVVSFATVAPLIVSTSTTVAEFSYMASLFLMAVIVCNALIATQVAVWLSDAAGAGSGE